MLIREVMPQDLQAVLDFSEALAMHEERPWQPLTTSSTFAYNLHHQRYAGFVATDLTGQSLGGVNCSLVGRDSPDLEVQKGLISNFYVRPAQRGRGVGQALISEAEEWLQEQGADVAYLQVIQPLTSPIHDYYLRRGYDLVSSDPYAFCIYGKFRPNYSYVKWLGDTMQASTQ